MSGPTSLSEEAESSWKIVGFVILAVRFVQGWIFWGGGSRRFIYAPQKLDPHASQWMANKLQSAMPGALLGIQHVVSFLLQHFIVLYIAIILFSLTELLSGIALVAGLFTRAAGFITALLSITLMLIFGWEGSTCLDEWTMAVSNLAMGLTLALSGAAVYSVDHWLLHRYPNLKQNKWFVNLASGPLAFDTLKRRSLVCAIFVIIFTLSTYDYYRGAIFSRYHAGPVSADVHRIALTSGQLESNGKVKFTAYVNAGNASSPSYIIRIELLKAGNVVEVWEGEDLSLLPVANIQNDYAYNKIEVGEYGLAAPLSAKATITLPPTNSRLKLDAGPYQLQVYTIGGQRFDLNLFLASHREQIIQERRRIKNIRRLAHSLV